MHNFRVKPCLSSSPQKTVLIGFLLCLLLLRGLIPAGYMPNFQSMASGYVELTLCTNQHDSETVRIQLDIETETASVSDSTNSAELGASICIYALLGQQFCLDLTRPTTLALIPASQGKPVKWPASVITHSILIGSPLGSRAPPIAI